GHMELCVLAEELGRAIAPIPFSSTLYFFAEALLLAGNDAQKAARLPKIPAGELIGCLATSEGPGPATPASLKTTVAGERLTGEKLPVTDGECADQAIVLAREGGQASLFLVDLNGPGVERQ